MRRSLVGIGIIAVGMVAAAGWFARKPLLANYYVHGLESAADDVEPNYEAIARLGEPAVGPLLSVLRKDGAGSERAAKALGMIVLRLPEDDPHVTNLAGQLAASFSDFSARGRREVLQQVVDPLLTRCPASRDSCREIIKQALKDSEPTNRLAAMPFAMRRDIGLAPEVVLMLSDGKVEVRRSAMLAVGSLPETIPADDLLHWLHDPDKTVRELCEAALKLRGLRDKDVRMARLVSDESFLKRLEVIRYLPNDNQIDPQVWLQRLSQDPVPAVRAAAARAGMQSEWQLDVDFRGRVQEMANSDPDGTVRQIAGHLLAQKSR